MIGKILKYVRQKEKLTQKELAEKIGVAQTTLSGYETKYSASVLESNLTEVGLAPAVIHDKGSYCHGRSNLLFQYPNSRIIYLSHGLKELDDLLIDSINGEYSNISVFDTNEFKPVENIPTIVSARSGS